MSSLPSDSVVPNPQTMPARPRTLSLLAAVARTRARHWHFMARAWLVAPSIEVSMRAAGIKRTLGWLDQLPPRRHTQRRVDVCEGAQLVRWACKLQPLARNACLTQSLVQYALHRRDGVPARFVLGVRHLDAVPTQATTANPARKLAAHAWVQPPDDSHPAPNYHTLFTQDVAP